VQPGASVFLECIQRSHTSHQDPILFLSKRRHLLQLHKRMKRFIHSHTDLKLRPKLVRRSEDWQLLGTVQYSSNKQGELLQYSQTCLISHWRDCQYYAILNGVDITRSFSTEVNINIQPFALLLYTTVNINVHIQLHDLQCTSTVQQKVSYDVMLLCLLYS